MFNLQQLLDPATSALLDRILAYLEDSGFENMDEPETYLGGTAAPSGTDARYGIRWARDNGDARAFHTVYDYSTPNGGVLVLLGVHPGEEEGDEASVEAEHQTTGVIRAQLSMQVDEHAYAVPDDRSWDEVVEPLLRALVAEADAVVQEEEDD